MVSFTALTKFFTAFTALTFIILTFCGIDSASPGYRVLFIDYAEREFCVTCRRKPHTKSLSNGSYSGSNLDAKDW